ncbi:MAG: RAMP superfamily CRISPR-associated protein [Chitinophagales bacterium]|nr:RAMP superfamily CRISPR-associated protein [Chitinophagales bacterium]
MTNIGKTIIKGKVRIVTPVHIGGAQEKHLMSGLDYLNKDNKIFFFDDKKLIKEFGIDNYSNALSENGLRELIKNRHRDIEDFSNKQATITGVVGLDIKANIKNALSGKPIIPGSSLKGSLRSVLYNLAEGGRNNRNVFGRIEVDMFRFLIVGDIEFNRSTYINTKIYNLRTARENGGGWKNAWQNNTTEHFNENGFTTAHEVIEKDDFSDFEIIINNKAFEKALVEGKVMAPANVKNIFIGQADLFEIIKEYTKNYLKAEIAFFEKYKGQHSDVIIAELNRLLALNENSPLLRLGLGSGFHAMTGDTLHDSHLIDSIHMIGNRSRGTLNRYDSAKSRKLAFEKIGEEFKFYPMGFIQLFSDEDWIKDADKLIKEQEASKIQEQAKIAEEKARQEKEQALKEEAMKPKMVELSFLGNRPKWVDAKVVAQRGTQLIFKPFILGFEDKEFDLRYGIGMDEGTIIQVECTKQGNNIRFQGSPRKKQG